MRGALEMTDKKQKKIKVVIIVLSILLAISFLALVKTVVYNRLAANNDSTATAKDNLITPDLEKNNNTNPNDKDLDDKNMNTSDVKKSENVSDINSIEAASIALYNKQPKDNTAFAVGNMFPGDKEIRYYRVHVSYHDKITVHFNADIRKGYEKLAEVMKVRVKLLGGEKIIYDGLMKDMSDSITYKLTTDESTTDELCYEITAYLDTSVGNEYQNRDLVADFMWWVEETGNLDKAPQTGDDSNIVLWSVMAILSLFAMFILLVFRRKEEDKQND